MPKGDHQLPLWVQFDAPSRASYEDALMVLRRCRYRYWGKMGAKRLKVGTFTTRENLLRIYWVEPRPAYDTLSRRLEFRSG